MEEAITYAKKYVEDLLSFFGLNTDVKASHEDDVIEISIPSTYLNGFLIGQRGDTMRSLQFLTSSALKSQGYEYTRVNLDVADYKKHRQDRLARQVEKWVEEIRKAKKVKVLKPMNPADRRIVHKVIGEYSDLETASDGYGRDRHVVITPVDVTEEDYDDEAVDEPTKDTAKDTPTETPPTDDAKDDTAPKEAETDAPETSEKAPEKEAKK